MSLFEPSTNDEHNFPNLPAFLVAVELRDTPMLGPGQKGIFATAPISNGTKIWAWTERVQSIHHSVLEEYISKHYSNDLEAIQLFLRQGFVLPHPEEKLEYFNSNPTDAGRFMNHSNVPNCGPDGAICDIQVGDELTMDYGFHGNPVWYQDICHKYGILTESEIAKL